jgi:hypothetical protein
MYWRSGNNPYSRSTACLGFTWFFLLTASSIQVTASNAGWPTQPGDAYITMASESIPPFPKRLSGYISKAGHDFWGKPFRSRGNNPRFSGARLAGNTKFPEYNERLFRWRLYDPLAIG